MKYFIALFRMFLRSFLLETVWNFERMQNVGFLYSMMPFFKALYPDKGERKKVLKRHIEFFNIHPYMVSIVLGIVASKEKTLKEGKTQNVKEIISIKKNMAGPLAALGDTFFWATWRPFVSLIAITFLILFYGRNDFLGTWFIPIIFLTVYNALTLFFRYIFLVLSYKMTSDIIVMIGNLKFQKIINFVRFTGLFVLVFSLLYYLRNFSSTMNELFIYLVMFFFFILIVCLRVLPSMLFYLTVAICLALGFLGVNL